MTDKKTKKSDETTGVAKEPPSFPSITVTLMPDGKLDIIPDKVDVRAVPTVLEMSVQQYRRALGLPTIG